MILIGTLYLIGILGLIMLATRAERRKLETERKKMSQLLLVAARGRRYK